MQSLIRTKSRGFTLIELTVVLMILIALAGIMIPLLTGYVTRSHASSAASNIGELSQNLTLYQVKYLQGYPDGYDSLCDASGAYPLTSTGASTMSWATAPAAIHLDAGQVLSLQSNGIQNLFTMVNPLAVNASATFDAANYTSAPTPITTASFVAQLDNTVAQQVLGLNGGVNGTEIYVLLGVGHGCTAVGKTMVDAPLHFDQTDPGLIYSRFLAVYAIPPAGGSATSPAFNARLVGVLDPDLTGLADHFRDYYSKNSQ